MEQSYLKISKYQNATKDLKICEKLHLKDEMNKLSDTVNKVILK